MTTKAASHKQVTKVIRVTLSEDGWRRLRLRAADQDLSMTRLLGSILEAEAARVAIRNVKGGS